MNSRRVLPLALIIMILFILLSLYIVNPSPPSSVISGHDTDMAELDPQSDNSDIATQTADDVNEASLNHSVNAPDAAHDSTRPITDGGQQAAQSATDINQGTSSRATATASTTEQSESSAPMLSERVFNVIDEAQWLQQSDQWEESLVGLNALYADFESMNPFEQMTLLNFYTNTLIRLEMWQESISAFTLMLTIPELRSDINARALMALGQLHERVNEPSVAVSYYEEWLSLTRDTPGLETQTAAINERLSHLR